MERVKRLRFVVIGCFLAVVFVHGVVWAEDATVEKTMEERIADLEIGYERLFSLFMIASTGKDAPIELLRLTVFQKDLDGPEAKITATIYAQTKGKMLEEGFEVRNEPVLDNDGYNWLVDMEGFRIDSNGNKRKVVARATVPVKRTYKRRIFDVRHVREFEMALPITID